MQYYNRYQNFFVNGTQTVVPYVTLPSRSTDQRYVYRDNQTRLDKLSYEKYGSPYFGWLIMMANPSYGGLETNIPDGTILNILGRNSSTLSFIFINFSFISNN